MLDWETTYITAHATADSPPVRIGVMTPSTTPRATALFIPGRGDSLELRLPVARRLAGDGITTVMVEHRGQGGSGHLGDHPDAVHVDSFDHHIDDIATVLGGIRGAVHLIGHSMGGLLGAVMLGRQPQRFASATLSSPMWGFAGPTPNCVARSVAQLVSSAGRSTRFAAGELPFDLVRCVDMRCSTTPELGPSMLVEMSARHRDLVRGGSTWGWVAAASTMIAELGRCRFEQVSCPITVASCRRDRTVSLRAHRRVASRFETARVVELECGHDPFFAPDSAHRQWWSEIEANLRVATA